MSIVGDDGINDLLNDNIEHFNDDQLPDEANDNINIFGEEEVGDDQSAESATTAPVKLQPKKRAILNPRPRLNVEVLRGPRGLHTIEDYFKDVKYKGKGHEREDLDEVLRRLQHWGHRMYPTYKFDDVLTNIERLGKKKPLQVHMSRYRLGMLESMKNHGEINEDIDDDDEDQPPNATGEPYDEFDALLNEQIAISKVAPHTPEPKNRRPSSGGSGLMASGSISSSSITTPSFSRGNAVASTPCTSKGNLDDSVLAIPSTSCEIPMINKQLAAEQMARIAENKRLAQERLAAKKRLKQLQS